MRKPLVNDKVFVEIYGKSNDRSELVKILKKFKIFNGRSDEDVAVYAAIRACHLRKTGSNLPAFKRGRKPNVL